MSGSNWRPLILLLVAVLAACGSEPSEQREVSSASSHQHRLDRDYRYEPYPGSRWYGPEGEPVSEDTNIINAITGPDHCNWESAVMMHVGWPLGHDASDISESRQYMRDPEGLFRDRLMSDFEANVALPKEATFSGYRTDYMELWLDEDDDRAAYLVFADHTERWPRAKEVIACG